MEEPWSRICLTWAQSLGLAPVPNILSLIDGKFFHKFLHQFLNHSHSFETTSETFVGIGALLKNEFPGGEVVNLRDAAAGCEDELVKLVTLLMYLGTVKHSQRELVERLEDSQVFTKEVRHRFKCVFQALLEQQPMLTSSVLTEIILSRVSETTGHLVAPIVRARIASNSMTRVGKPSPQSPVIFASSPSSPLKEFLDSPITRQVNKFQVLLDERTRQNRLLRSELEAEKTERQFAVDEMERLKADRQRLELELVNLKQEYRERAADLELNTSQNGDVELREKYHKLINENREENRFRAELESQIEAAHVEKENLTKKLEVLRNKLEAANDDKSRFEIALENMRVDLSTTSSENQSLSSNVAELQLQLQDLLQQQLQTSNMSISSGRKSLAPGSMVHFHQCDMTNVSLDGDESLSQQLSPGENMRDLVLPQLEERIEMLKMELDSEKEENRQLTEQLEEHQLREKQLEEQLQERKNTERLLSEKIEHQQRQETRLSEQLTQEQAEKLQLSERLSEKQQMECQLCSQLETETQARQLVESNLAQETAERTSLATELLKKKEEIHNLVADVTSLKEIVSAREADLAVERESISVLARRLEDEAEEKAAALAELETEKQGRAKVVLKLREEQEQRKNCEARLGELTQEKAIVEQNLLKVCKEMEESALRQEQAHKQMEELAVQKQEIIVKFDEMKHQCEMLETGLLHEKSVSQAIQGQLETEQAKVRELQQQVAETGKKLSQFEIQLETAAVERESLLNDLEASKVKLEYTHLEMEGLRHELEGKQLELESVSNKKNVLACDLESSRIEAETLRQERDVLAENLEAGKVQAEALFNELEVSRAQIKAINQEKLGVIADLESSRAQLAAEVQEKENLLRDLEVTRTQLETLGSEKETLAKETEAKIMQLEAIAGENNVLVRELESKRTQLEMVSKENEALSSRFQASQLEQEVLRQASEASLESKHIEVTIRERLEEEKTAAEAAVTKLENEKSVLETRLSAGNAEILQLKAILVKNKETEEQLRLTTDQMASKIENLLRLQEKYEAQEQELKKVEKDRHSLIEQVQNLEAALKAGKAEVAEKTAELEQVLVQGKQLAAKMDSMDEEIGRLQQELEHEMTSARKAEARAEEAETLRVAHEQNLATVSAQLASLNQQLLSVTSGQEAAENQVSAATAEIETVRQELEAAAAKLADVEAQCSQLRLELDNREAACRLHCGEIDDLKELLQEARQERGSQLQKSADKYHKLAILQDELKEELKLEREKVAIGIKEMEQLQADYQLIAPAVETLTREKEELEQVVLRLREAISERELTGVKQAAELSRLREQLDLAEDKLTSADSENVHKLEFLQSQLEEEENAKATLKAELATLQLQLSEAQAQLAASQDQLETAESQAADKVRLLEKEVAERNNIAAEKARLESSVLELTSKLSEAADLKAQMEQAVGQERLKLEAEKADLSKMIEKIEAEKAQAFTDFENRLTEETTKVEAEKAEVLSKLNNAEAKIVAYKAAQEEQQKSKETLATQVTQLVTQTTTLTASFEKSVSELNNQVANKEKVITELRSRVAELESATELERKEKEKQLEEKERKMEEMQEELDRLRQDLASAEIRCTDLEQTLSSKDGAEDVATALASQKARYEDRLKEVKELLTQQAKQKMTQLRETMLRKIETQDAKIKQLTEENRGLTEKLASVDNKVEQMEAFNNQEIRVFREKYEKEREERTALQHRFDAAKELLQKSKREQKQMQEQLTAGRPVSHELEGLRRELIQVKTENRTLHTQLNLADSKLRETSRLESRLSLSGRANSSERLVPGRATRQSTSNLPDSDTDNVFKLPSSSHTPGRAKAGRTVSDTRMGARRTKPPTGSGSLFSCDEEEGELFSNSYLTDLKDGKCDVTMGDDSRMSELSRRNTLCLPHLKSSYPVEHQFCTDKEITEEALRLSQVKLPRVSGVAPLVPSPVTRLSLQASSLSLDSPAAATRSRARLPHQEVAESKPVQKPVAFTVDAPRPGRVERRGAAAPTNTTGRPAKQPCQSEHNGDGQADQSVVLSPDYLRLGRKRKSDVLKAAPLPPQQHDQPQQLPPPQQAQPPQQTNSVDLDSSQDSDTSYLSRESLRGSKRYKKEAGNVSYNKPGPPTPARNKSLNRSRHENSLTSMESALAATPQLNLSGRSSSRTPLVDQTNSAAAAGTPSTRAGSKNSRQTPMSKFKTALSTTFRKSSSSYKPVKKQLEGLGPKGTTPINGKDREPARFRLRK